MWSLLTKTKSQNEYLKQRKGTLTVSKSEIQDSRIWWGWYRELGTCRLWEMLVRIRPFLNLTAEWRSALWCTAEQDSVWRCDESWHTVTVTLSQMRQQELPRSCSEVTQGPPKTQIVDSKRLGSLETNWPRNLLNKGCLLFFSLQLFLTRVSQCLGCQL